MRFQPVPKVFDRTAVLTVWVKVAGESFKSASVGEERCGQLMR